jgi:hypothetical protein
MDFEMIQSRISGCALRAITNVFLGEYEGKLDEHIEKKGT